MQSAIDVEAILDDLDASEITSKSRGYGTVALTGSSAMSSASYKAEGKPARCARGGGHLAERSGLPALPGQRILGKN
jgi:hypothetical protein